MVSASVTTAKPRLYYGWVMVGGLAITEMVSWGILYYAFSIFMTPMHAEFGWSRSGMSGAFSLGLLMNGITSLLVGRLLDRHGTRILMTCGSISAMILLLAWSQVVSLPALYGVWAGIGIVMALVLYEPAFAVIATWFLHQRGKALTLLTFVGGLASVIFIPLTNFLIETYTWRTALVILAFILGTITIPIHALILRRHPADLGLLPDGMSVQAHTHAHIHLKPSIRPRAAMQHSTFWWLVGGFMLSTLVGVGLTVHLTPYLIDRGYSSTFAASVAGMAGLMSLPGRLIFTILGDYIPRRWVTAFIFALQPVGFIIFLTIPTTAGVWLGIAFFGFAFGAITPARAALIADYYGAGSYGSINGTVAMFTLFARALAPVSAGLIYDASGSYQPVLALMLVISLISTGLIPMAKPISTNR